MSEPVPLYQPAKNEPMPVVCFMSGSGTNVRRIIEHERAFLERKEALPYKVIGIFTDKPMHPKCKAIEIADEYGIGTITHGDIDEFYQRRDYKDKKDPRLTLDMKKKIREEYDEETKFSVEAYSKVLGYGTRPVIALGGYMSLLTWPIINNFLGINVHPADLTILNAMGKRRFTGDNAVRDAIKAGQSRIYSSTHIVEDEPDMGKLIMISAPLEVDLDGHGLDDLLITPKLMEKVAGDNQDRLKKAGDWVIFPRTLEDIARGRIALQDNNIVYRTSDDGEWKRGPIRLQ